MCSVIAQFLSSAAHPMRGASSGQLFATPAARCGIICSADHVHRGISALPSDPELWTSGPSPPDAPPPRGTAPELLPPAPPLPVRLPRPDAPLRPVLRQAATERQPVAVREGHRGVEGRRGRLHRPHGGARGPLRGGLAQPQRPDAVCVDAVPPPPVEVRGRPWASMGTALSLSLSRVSRWARSVDFGRISARLGLRRSPL